MTFLTSQEIDSRLAELVPQASPDAVDCNAVTLRVGAEVFITPDSKGVNTTTVRKLDPGEWFILPPGQFASLLTEERVHVPPNTMAFISMKATYKLMGLVNVSGFHVDPGFSGPLVFSVLNAGPSPIHLQRGMPLFLIWYAWLSDASEKRKTAPAGGGMPPLLLNRLSGSTETLHTLDERLSARLTNLEKSQGVIKTALAGLGAAAIAIGGAIYPLFLAPYYKQVDPSEKRVPTPPLADRQEPSTLPSHSAVRSAKPASADAAR